MLFDRIAQRHTILDNAFARMPSDFAPEKDLLQELKQLDRQIASLSSATKRTVGKLYNSTQLTADDVDALTRALAAVPNPPATAVPPQQPQTSLPAIPTDPQANLSATATPATQAASSEVAAPSAASNVSAPPSGTTAQVAAQTTAGESLPPTRPRVRLRSSMMKSGLLGIATKGRSFAKLESLLLELDVPSNPVPTQVS